MRQVLFSIFALLLIPSLLFADAKVSVKPEKRGFVTSSSCPFSCKQANVPIEFCRESRVGTTCRVEDLRKGPGHQTLIRVPKSTLTVSPPEKTPVSRRAVDGTWIDVSRARALSEAPPPGKRGLITSAACPYSCGDTQIPAAYCRESQMNGVCRVEDLRQAPGHRSLVRLP